MNGAVRWRTKNPDLLVTAPGIPARLGNGTWGGLTWAGMSPPDSNAGLSFKLLSTSKAKLSESNRGGRIIPGSVVR